MKIEELNELKEKVEQLIKKRNEVLEIQEEIKKLEETDEIKKYLNLLNLFQEKTTGRSCRKRENIDSRYKIQWKS